MRMQACASPAGAGDAGGASGAGVENYRIPPLKKMAQEKIKQSLSLKSKLSEIWMKQLTLFGFFTTLQLNVTLKLLNKCRGKVYEQVV